MFKMFSERFLYRDKRGKGKHVGMINRPESFAKSRAKDKMSDAIAKSKHERLKEQDVMKTQLHEKPVEHKELSEGDVVEKFAKGKLKIERETRMAIKILGADVFSGFA